MDPHCCFISSPASGPIFCCSRWTLNLTHHLPCLGWSMELVTRALLCLLHLPAGGLSPGQWGHCLCCSCCGCLAPVTLCSSPILAAPWTQSVLVVRSLDLAVDFMHLSQANPYRTEMKCNSRAAHSSFSEDNLCSLNLVCSQMENSLRTSVFSTHLKKQVLNTGHWL